MRDILLANQECETYKCEMFGDTDTCKHFKSCSSLFQFTEANFPTLKLLRT